MNLFLFFVVAIILSIINNQKLNRYNNILYLLVFCCIVIVYCVFSANSYASIHFLPKKDLNVYFHTGNFYNWLMTSFFKFKLNLDVNANFVNYLSNLPSEYLFDQNSVPIEVKMFYDTSIYDNKIYLYFGITPIILFYAPFYLITHFFISDQIVYALLSVIIFVLQLLILKKVLLYLIQSNILKKDINKYFNVITLIVLSLCNGIPLTYISITVHSIAVLTSIFCQLVAIYLCLLLVNNFTKRKMFFIGLFLTLAVGSRPSSIILLLLLFVFMLYIFNIKKYWKQYLCFFIPIIIYGIILATYNYMRFNSIFDFGLLYQFGPMYNKNSINNFNVSFITFAKNIFFNIFYLPTFTFITPLCLFKNPENLSHFEPMIGGFIICPIVVFLLFIKKIFIRFFNDNKNIPLLIIVMLITSLCYILLNSCMGSNARFVAEYLSLLLVPSFISFYVFVENINNIKLQKIVYMLFFSFVIFSLYVNINLMNCIFIMSKNGMI